MSKLLKTALALGSALALFTVAAACTEDDEEPDGIDTTPTTLADASPATTPDDSVGGDGSDVEERYEELEQKVAEVSEDARDQVNLLWKDTQAAFEDWQNATEDEREALEEEFDEQADALEDMLEQLTDGALSG